MWIKNGLTYIKITWTALLQAANRVSISDANDMTDIGSRWWHFPHEADMGIAAASPSLEHAFELAAHAMMAVITEASVAAREAVSIRCSAPDVEALLVDWLNSLIYEMATRRVLFGRFEVRIETTNPDCQGSNTNQLFATAWGEPVEVARHEPAVEVKGATFTALEVKRDHEGVWQVRCVLDV